jgi:hypothetical protein
VLKDLGEEPVIEEVKATESLKELLKIDDKEDSKKKVVSKKPTTE